MLRRDRADGWGGRQIARESSVYWNMWRLYQFASVNGSSFKWLWMVSSEMYHHPNIMHSQVIPYNFRLLSVFFCTHSVSLCVCFSAPALHFVHAIKWLYITFFLLLLFFILQPVCVRVHVTTIENNKYLPNSLSFHQFHFLSISLLPSSLSLRYSLQLIFA